MSKVHTSNCASENATNIAAGNVIPRECDCDGYHTYAELYDHRITLWIAYCKLAAEFEKVGTSLTAGRVILHSVWRSKRHSDGELCFGTGTQFVLGLSHSPGKQITYHIPIGRWSETEFAETLDTAPEWDKHSSQDVLDRLKAL